eukprot:212834_1
MGSNASPVNLCGLDNDADRKYNSCSKSTRFKHYYKTTAGIASIVKPCQIVCDHEEVYGCEGPTQMSLFVWSVFQTNQETISRRPKCLKYDCACMLRPSVEARIREGNVPDTFCKVWDSQVIKGCCLDDFHSMGHVKDQCRLDTHPEKMKNPNAAPCMYHPKAPQFAPFHGSQGSACEQQYSRWGPDLKDMCVNKCRYINMLKK